ncbi:hypothetical protein BJ742DRAFT_855091 [Cladochytrium replicatum]|nr:hypothetical protein BJ742DRAFT_855091 [Cladochytrium replicatum]
MAYPVDERELAESVTIENRIRHGIYADQRREQVEAAKLHANWLDPAVVARWRLDVKRMQDGTWKDMDVTNSKRLVERRIALKRLMEDDQAKQEKELFEQQLGFYVDRT